MVTLVGLITIGLSTYLILYSHPLHDRLAPWLGLFERAVPHREGDEPEAGVFDAIVIGMGRFGTHISAGLRALGVRVAVVDFDPQVICAARKRGIEAHYGDAEDPELPLRLPLRGVQWVIGTMPDLQANRMFVKHLREHGYRGDIAVTAHSRTDAETLSALGAGMILLPYKDAADQAVERLASVMHGLTKVSSTVQAPSAPP